MRAHDPQKSRSRDRQSRRFASPRARRALTRLGIDLRTIRGTGPRGRIVEADVVRGDRGDTSSSLTKRRVIAQRTSESFSKTPHFYLKVEIDATHLLARRQELQGTGPVKLTVTDFLLRAMAGALRACPWANAIWQDDAIRLLSTVDIGLVVGLEDGLLVPVIREADHLDLFGLAERRSELVAAARSGRLSRESMQGGAASLSNLGTQAVDEFQAVIMPPQSTMLAVARARPRPFVVDGQLCVRPTIRLCLSADHRVLDGRPAAEFLSHVVRYLEDPIE